jgi:hypothetical protein
VTGDVGLVRVLDVQRRTERALVAGRATDVAGGADLGFLHCEFVGVLAVHLVGEDQGVLEDDQRFIRDVADRQKVVRHGESPAKRFREPLTG